MEPTRGGSQPAIEPSQQALEAERLAAIGQVVKGLTHASRNALQRSQACLEMLALEVQDRPRALDLIGRIQKAQDHLHRLFEEVREYAGIALHKTPCRLDEVWRRAWSRLEAARQGREAVLLEEIHVTDLACCVDPLRLEQTFRNIFDNALTACTDPVRIRLRCCSGEVDGRAALQVLVTDNGPGLSEEQGQRMLEPFFTTKTRGAGLGLAMAQRIVEAHGGRIKAGNALEGGTAIEVTLPRGLS